MKICNKCKVEKEEFDYYKNKKGKDGLRPECKSCFSSHYPVSRSIKTIIFSDNEWEVIVQACIEYKETDPKKLLVRLCEKVIEYRKKKAG